MTRDASPPAAKRLASVTRAPILDRRRDDLYGLELHVGDVVLPRAGDATVTVDSRSIRFTHLDRVLWPEAGFTKGEMVAYYLAVAPAILPHLADRPLTVGRFPGGVDGRGFAQAEVPGRPEWMRTTTLTLANGKVRAFTLVDDRAGLAWLAQMGCIELHTFLARAPDLERPTMVLFDLDPTPPATLADAAIAACALAERLDARGLASLVKTSGSLGIHVVVPLDEPTTYEATRTLAHAVARELVTRYPERISDALPRADRAGKVLVDVRQNSRRLTMAAPYTLRSAPRPFVSTPVSWIEVERAVGAADSSLLAFEPDAVLTRIAEHGDLFARSNVLADQKHTGGGALPQSSQFWKI